jgi:hypothetical protein
VFLVNSRFPLVTATRSSSGREVLHPTGALLLPKLRRHFAEFLNHSSPDRLGILYLPTCVGLGYGHRASSARGFSWQHRINDFACTARYHVSGFMRPGFPGVALHAYPRTTIAWVHLPSCVPHLLPASKWVGSSPRRQPLSNRLGLGADTVVPEYQPVVHRLRLRPRLSSRLTLGGLAFPRNPWAFGGGVSHPSFATHANILTRPRSTTVHPPLRCEIDAPLPLRKRMTAASALDLSPVTLSAQDHSTSELLRTLSRVAASKPTSWLSVAISHRFPLSPELGALAGGLGCFPLDHEAHPPWSHCRALESWHSEFGWGR